MQQLPLKISAITGYSVSLGTHQDQKISCTINGLDKAADIKWTDANGGAISTTDTANYIIDKGSKSAGGSQTTTLTLKKVVMEKITSAKTYKCSATSGNYAASGWFDRDVVITPLGESSFVKECVALNQCVKL